MNTQNLNVKDSLEVLLNIKTYEKLIENIRNVQKEYKRDKRFSYRVEKLKN